MVKQTKTSKTPDENSLKSHSLQLNIPGYPNSRPIPTEKAPKGIQILEMVSNDTWQDVLSFYQETFSKRGWELFASNQLADRGSISFHPTEQQTVTILAANENSLTHIRIYIQA